MDQDFGIIPYPKFDEEQDQYYSRASFYMPNVVPVTNSDLEMTGAVLEALNCAYANEVVPAYFEITLKTKYSRDTESEAMLDLVMENRVIDLGDTTLCGIIRDGFMFELFRTKNENLVSRLKSQQSQIQAMLDDLIERSQE